MKKIAQVRAEILCELAEIQVCTQNTARYRERLETSSDPFDREVLSKALAAELHSFYTGAERIFEKVAKHVDRHKREKSANWHKDLLVRMTIDIPNIRYSIVSPPTYLILDELRRFRHVVRSNYLHNLKPELILDLAVKAESCHKLLLKDFKDFDLYLGRLDS